jgi:ABC-type Zn2+ transport system substrate-binding protein/surface adhesin
MDVAVAVAAEDAEVAGVIEAIKAKEIITIAHATGVTKEVILTATALPNSFNLQMELLDKIAKVKLMLLPVSKVSKASNSRLH